MGSCVSGRSSIQRLQVVPRELRSFIDQFQSYELTRLEEKFDESCKQCGTPGQMKFAALKHYFGDFFAQLSVHTQTHLWEFFNEEDDDFLVWREFVSRLAILLFAPVATLNRVIFNLYDHGYKKSWTREKLDLFSKENARFLVRSIEMLDRPMEEVIELPMEQFVHMLHEDNFDYDGYRAQFASSPAQEEDQQQLCEEVSSLTKLPQDQKKADWFVTNEKVYVLSWRWYEKWKLYIDSPKLMRSPGRRSTCDMEGLGVKSIVEKPVRIDNSELEGEYQGELLPNIIRNHHYLLLTQALWKRLYSIYGGGPVFERVATNINIVQLYPVTLQLLVTDRKGKVVRESLQRKRYRAKTVLNDMLPSEIPFENGPNAVERCLFSKNLGSMDWTELPDLTLTLGQTNLSSQCFLAVVFKSAVNDFVKRYRREEVTVKNLDYGDRVYAMSVVESDHRPAFVMNVLDGQFLVHYINSPYSYDRVLKSNNLSIENLDNSSSNTLPPNTKKKKSEFRGIKNMGNTCFINAAFQSLLAVPMLTSYLANKQELKMISGRSKKKLHLAGCLAQIVSGESQNQPIDSQSLKSIISTELPSFSGCQQHDAQEFLSMFLNSLAEEVKLEEVREKEKMVIRNVINELFQGSAQNTMTCNKCHHERKKTEEFFTLSLPLPQLHHDYYKIQIFPCSFEQPERMQRIGFRLPKNSTVEEYLKEFERIVKRNNEEFFLIEVYSSSMNRMINLKSNLGRTLSQIYLRPDTNIFAYEKNRRAYEMKQIVSDFDQPVAKDMIIDYLKELRETKEIWSFGRIEQIVKDEDQHKTFITLSEGIYGKQTIEYEDEIIAPFLSKTHANPSANIKVMHRKFNAGTGKIEVFGLPFIATTPYWATFAQVQELIGKQIHHFLVKQEEVQASGDKNFRTVKGNDEYFLPRRRSVVPKIAEHSASSKILGRGEMRCQTSELIKRSHSRDRQEETTPSKASRDLKDHPPYKIIILNQKEDACPRCQLPQDAYLKPTSTGNCTCQISAIDPLSWQYELSKCVYAIDWLNTLEFNPHYANSIINHESYTRMQELERADVKSLKDCLDIYSAAEEVALECEKCHSKTGTIQLHIQKQPAILIIHLNRFKMEERYMVKLENRIRYDFQLDIGPYTTDKGSSQYELFSVVCHIGTGSQGHYTSFVQRQHPIDRKPLWVLFDDDEVKVVARQHILDLPAYMLFYRRKTLPSSTYVNYLIKPFG